MKTYINPSQEKQKQLVKRPVLSEESLQLVIKDVFDQVKTYGDEALVKFTKKFDQVGLSDLVVNPIETEKSLTEVPQKLKDAIKQAATNIEQFHTAQKTEELEVETTSGVVCRQITRPIEKVGIYIPGGTAPLFSTVLMLGIPAKIAGVEEVILCTPPDKEGNINPVILFTAQLIGIQKIFKLGGAQAIAAMSYGTATVPKVFKICGPGNQYVTAAKHYAFQIGVAIDMPAGPSELLVLADDTAIPAFVAADLLSQAEHGGDSQVVCVLSSKALIKPIQHELQKQLKNLPRKIVALEALQNSMFVVIESAKNRIDFVNSYAPEHLIIAEKKPKKTLEYIKNAGSVFLGNFTPESAGDYASGTNHTLPTNGFARSFSGVGLNTFQKQITVQEISEDGIRNLGETIMQMAKYEQLEAHSAAVEIRIKKLENEA